VRDTPERGDAGAVRRFSRSIPAPIPTRAAFRAKERPRTKLSTTVDAVLRERERTIEAQYAPPRSAQEQEEHAAWQQRRRTAATRLFRAQ